MVFEVENNQMADNEMFRRMTNQLALTVRGQRVKRWLTQSSFARQAGVQQSAISVIESGICTLLFTNYLKFQNFLIFRFRSCFGIRKTLLKSAKRIVVLSRPFIRLKKLISNGIR